MHGVGRLPGIVFLKFSRPLLSGPEPRVLRSIAARLMTTPSRNEYTDLLSMTVHELRSPISVVGGYLRMLLRNAPDPLTARQRKLIEAAEGSCGRLRELAQLLSDISKLDDGRLTLAQQPLELGALIAEVATHVHEANDRNVHLVLEGDPGPASISGDADRLRSAFRAVFQAILREKAGPATVVAARRHDRVDGVLHATVVVADAGAVQESYDRPRHAFNERRGGVALELALARRVIERHGGRLAAPAPVIPPDESGEEKDPLTRGSAIIMLPLTE
jgi:signal transduction histidine kinase